MIETVFKKTLNFAFTSYKYSRLKNITDKISTSSKNSVSGKYLNKFLDKTPWYFNSITGRFIFNIGKILKKIANFIYSLISPCIKNSEFKKQTSEIKNSPKTLFNMLALLFMAASLTYLIGCIYIGAYKEIRLYISWILFITGFIFALLDYFYETALNSRIYKIIVYLFFE